MTQESGKRTKLGDPKEQPRKAGRKQPPRATLQAGPPEPW